MATNRKAYEGFEFEKWAHAAGLRGAERHLIEHYLSKGGATIEAGTGGGRIVRAMSELGFTSLSGFDFVPRLIEAAKSNDPRSPIRFDVQDAVHLGYGDDSFDQIVYLQQVVCFVETDAERRAALKEAHRILRVGGVGLFSFLWWEARQQSRGPRLYSRYLERLRTLGRTGRTLQSQPWLRHGNRINIGALSDRGPWVYWYRLAEAQQDLREAGFVIHAIGSTGDARRGRLLASAEHVVPDSSDPSLYVVCTKPGGGPAGPAVPG